MQLLSPQQKLNVHLQSRLPCCAAPFTVSVLPQSAPWLHTNSSSGGFYARHNVAGLTLCLWQATATVQHRFHILRPRSGHKNTGKGRKGKKKNKKHDWCLALILFSATLEWMIADYLWLSVQFRNNWSFCAYLIEDICLRCHYGMDLQHPVRRPNVFLSSRRQM